MKRFLPLFFILFAYLLLSGCASKRNPNLHGDLTKETWMRQVDNNPTAWAGGADSWFFRGEAAPPEIASREASYAAAISTMTVNVPDFTNIKVAGDFQLEIFGSDTGNSVYVYGPNVGLRSIAIEVRNNTLCINQLKNAPRTVKQVIVRVGISQLQQLIQLAGCGNVEGVRIRSNGLYITTHPGVTGNMYIGGNFALRRVDNAGNGRINLFGANTSWLDINTSGGGAVNVSGNYINVKRIRHVGNNNINIIGAHADGLRIEAAGRGKIGINGPIVLRALSAKGGVRVYAYPVTSTDLHVEADNDARIGLAGYANNLIVNTVQSSQFAGRYLCAQNAYVRAHDWSHINVATTERIFASATQNASVYFYGTPNSMSQFVSGNGVVIPIWSSTASSCVLAYRKAAVVPEREALVRVSEPRYRETRSKTYRVEHVSNHFTSPPPASTYHGHKVKSMVRYQNY